MITIKAAKAMLSPNTFNSVAILNRRNTLNKFLIIVFISIVHFFLANIIQILCQKR